MSKKGKSAKRNVLKRVKSAFETLFSQSKWINKYSLLLVSFIVWITFIDSHNLILQSKMTASIDRMETRKTLYAEKLLEVKKQQRDLEKNVKALAEEKYGFAKENEDVFIIEPKN